MREETATSEQACAGVQSLHACCPRWVAAVIATKDSMAPSNC
jgi:hypothetical protein